MHERFDNVDRELDAVFGSVNRNYEAILQTDADVGAIRKRMSIDSDRLEVLATRSNIAIQQQTETQFLIDRDRCLAYNERYHSSMLFDVYTRCMDSFSSTATLSAAPES